MITKPSTDRLFVDYAGLVPNDLDNKNLEKKLVAIDDSTSNQICVVTVKSLNNEEISDVTYATFNAWKIGNKKTDNGVLLLIALEDKKIRIEVGSGLEGAIPDIIAKSIIEKDLKPAFRQHNFLGGINAAVDHIAQAAVGDYKEAREKKTKTNYTSIIVLFFIIILVIACASNNNGGGGYRRSNIDWIAPIFFNNSGWSNSDWGGGGSSSGGFSGFGGGSSSGGGASGSW